MGAGAGRQVAAVFDQFHAPQIDLPVAFDCFFDGASGLGEGRRVQNDHVEFLPLFLQPREQLKHILAEELHPVGEAVQFRIFSCLGHAQFGCVHAQHVLRPGQPGIEGEGAGMGKAVQYPGPFAKFRRRAAVVFLIQEESCFLPIFDIHVVAHAVLHDLNLGIKRFADEALDALHPFLLAHLGVAALINAPDMDAVRFHQFFQDIHNHNLEPVDAKRQGLHHQHISKFIDHQPRQKVRLAKDHAAAGNVIHDFLPVFPGIFHPHTEKCLIHLRIPVPGHHADHQLRIAVDESSPQRIPVKIMDPNHVSVFKCSQHGVHFIIINPGAALLQGPAPAFFQCYNCF